MKRKIIAVIMGLALVILAFALVCGVLNFQGIRSSRAVHAPVAGATYQELNSFVNAKRQAAAARRLPPFRDVGCIVAPDRRTVTTGWCLRHGHPFLLYSVDYLYRYSDPREAILREGPSGFGIYGGTNHSRWRLKWDL
jgi:hypothetical protein